MSGARDLSDCGTENTTAFRFSEEKYTGSHFKMATCAARPPGWAAHVAVKQKMEDRMDVIAGEGLAGS